MTELAPPQVISLDDLLAAGFDPFGRSSLGEVLPGADLETILYGKEARRPPAGTPIPLPGSGYDIHRDAREKGLGHRWGQVVFLPQGSAGQILISNPYETGSDWTLQVGLLGSDATPLSVTGMPVRWGVRPLLGWRLSSAFFRGNTDTLLRTPRALPLPIVGKAYRITAQQVDLQVERDDAALVGPGVPVFVCLVGSRGLPCPDFFAQTRPAEGFPAPIFPVPPFARRWRVLVDPTPGDVVVFLDPTGFAVQTVTIDANVRAWGLQPIPPTAVTAVYAPPPAGSVTFDWEVFA